MKEIVLRDFLKGSVTAEDLASDLCGSIQRRSIDSYGILIEDMEDEYTVTAENLIMICDAYLSGKLNEENIRVIGFAMEASDTFDWEVDSETGKRIGDVIDCWSSPEINYKISEATMRKFKILLATGKDLFVRSDLNC